MTAALSYFLVGRPAAGRDRGLWRAANAALGLVIAVATLGMLSGCTDPYVGTQIEALGPEVEGFEESEFHRPGQPCLVCHSEGAGIDPLLSFAGTLFFRPGGDSAPFVVPDYTVEILDSKGLKFRAKSNRCGNFFIARKDFVPAFPVRASLLASAPGDANKLITNVVMTSRIGRDGSCARCHVTPANASSPGEIFVLRVGDGDPPQAPAPGACPPPYIRPPQGAGLQP